MEKFTIDDIRSLIITDREWLEKALVIVYKYQTNDEQSLNVTRYYNTVGFNKNDAHFMSSLARYIIDNKYNRPIGQRLTQCQVNALRNGIRVAKYARQVWKMITSNTPLEY